ncbi:hypothetical protein A2U01_0103520, partial [Trifolium medium]|nr:hypothetical protein [Trifolium medium]
FLGGLELKPPQSTLLCVLSPGEDHDVVGRGVATRSQVLAICRQLLANFLKVGR